MLKKKKKEYFSSNNIIDLQNVFSEKIEFSKSYLGIREICDDEIIPEYGKYNFITTAKSLELSLFLKLIDNIEDIVMFAAKINNKSLKQIGDLVEKTTLITTDENGELKGFKKIITCATHAKGLVIKSKDKYITILGSGNPAYNARREQYQIFNSKGIYNQVKRGLGC